MRTISKLYMCVSAFILGVALGRSIIETQRNPQPTENKLNFTQKQLEDHDEIVFKAGATIACKFCWDNPAAFKTSKEVQEVAWAYIQPALEQNREKAFK